MTSHQFSTRPLPSQQQFAAWVSWFEPLFDVAAPTDGERAGFAADARIWPLGQAALSRVQAPRLLAARGGRNIRRDGIDHWNVVIGGVDTRLTRAGQSVTIPAHTPFVISMGEPIDSEREADARVQLYLPRDHFATLAPILDRARGIPLLGPNGRLLADYLRLLERSIPDLPAEDLPRLSPAIQAMIAACIAPSAASLDQATAQLDLTRLEQIRQAIRRRMHSATLSAASLCREVGMSRSQLYRLLEGEGGVAHYVQRLRLRACHAALSDGADLRSIAAIAEACGFYDPSTFSRAFRREFGITPSDLRQAARAGAAPPAALAPTMTAEARNLRAYLRGG